MSVAYRRGYPRTKVTEGCELTCGCWALNLGPLDKEPLLLITKQSLVLIYNIFYIYLLYMYKEDASSSSQVLGMLTRLLCGVRKHCERIVSFS